ncbi:MAG: transcriptional repressor [Phycisphaeraceae bacterium]|nr:MAG: transcriptional repressor [Phycisphaeraceae bacterium]
MSERRSTRQQRAIRDALLDAGRPLSVEEIFQIAKRDVPRLGLRTVYRVVRRMEEEGGVSAVPVAGQTNRYEPAEVAARHHHHFYCESCDRLFDIDGCAENLRRLLPRGFRLRSHELTLTGECRECATSHTR